MFGILLFGMETPETPVVLRVYLLFRLKYFLRVRVNSKCFLGIVVISTRSDMLGPGRTRDKNYLSPGWIPEVDPGGREFELEFEFQCFCCIFGLFVW